MKITKSYLKKIITEELQKLTETNSYWRMRHLVRQTFEKSDEENKKSKNDQKKGDEEKGDQEEKNKKDKK